MATRSSPGRSIRRARSEIRGVAPFSFQIRGGVPCCQQLIAFNSPYGDKIITGSFDKTCKVRLCFVLLAAVVFSSRIRRQGLTNAATVCNLISQKMFLKSFCSSQLPHKSVDLSLTITNIKNKLTDLCGNRLLQNDFKNTL